MFFKQYHHTNASQSTTATDDQTALICYCSCCEFSTTHPDTSASRAKRLLVHMPKKPSVPLVSYVAYEGQSPLQISMLSKTPISLFVKGSLYLLCQQYELCSSMSERQHPLCTDMEIKRILLKK